MGRERGRDSMFSSRTVSGDVPISDEEHRKLYFVIVCSFTVERPHPHMTHQCAEI